MDTYNQWINNPLKSVFCGNILHNFLQRADSLNIADLIQEFITRKRQMTGNSLIVSLMADKSKTQ